MSRYLIQGGRVIDPANNIDDTLDVLIENGKIEAVGKHLAADAEVIDASGMIVAPGLVDMHVHLRDPGRTDEETVETGLRAAAKGGFTSIACMPNTDPVTDSASVVEYIQRQAKDAGFGNVFPIGAITHGLAGERLSEMGELIQAGAVGFSDDGKCVMNSQLMRRALEYTRMWGKPVISHAEDELLARNGQINEGYWSTVLGLKGIPSAAEEVIIARDIILAELTGGKLHIAHLSTAGSLDLVKRAKEHGVNVTCEVTPHHLILTDENLQGYDTNFKVNPPLRTAADIEALRKGLKDGIIDAIASDHAPHARHEKEMEFDYAPFGMIGLETTLGLILTELVDGGVLSLGGAIAKMSAGPSRILGIPKGSLGIGGDADLIVIDTNAILEVSANKFESKSINSPYVGRTLKGVVKDVFTAGEPVIKDKVFVDSYGEKRFSRVVL
ncbi:MAG: dihydroorotase [Candidatus Aquicultor secundus]|uniref:Dihydroorotase n=1 Tax=Candidatus Aquicultor secundus TaxID=1973895 RepID=A0A2M7T5A5_9ACTN|nr:dihydroorotase [Candidatus Aquicultor secundus]NCO65860.1 dihydroorotase [Solirubrobacter sp.]OIO86394.1 MAG: dihydroorotase [Candidatus Aquicultor secundus]PIU26353.1 MAG: dihydroorotase [Candidatus Aquicultor secundus]PIW22239.1 MAG: dihydroorotase [Candidatus Aquicultor secundus]PIX52830.1 MAG: dihydroorotase [Candidatus Aquicultor secundus]